MKTVTLDVARWGIGSLCDSGGQMCMMGQILHSRGIPKEILLHRHYPTAVSWPDRTVMEEFEKNISDICRVRTPLASRIASINDCTSLTPKEKIRELTKLFLKHNMKLEVVNCHLLDVEPK